MPDPEASDDAGPSCDERWALRHVEEALRGLQFGHVTIVVQDGVVVQVERTEKKRIKKSARKP